MCSSPHPLTHALAAAAAAEIGRTNNSRQLYEWTTNESSLLAVCRRSFRRRRNDSFRQGIEYSDRVMGTHEVINTPYQEQEFLVIVVNGTNRSSDTEKERE